LPQTTAIVESIFIRELALLIIFIYHVRPNFWRSYTLQRFAFFDAAEVFVLIWVHHWPGLYQDISDRRRSGMYSQNRHTLPLDLLLAPGACRRDRFIDLRSVDRQQLATRFCAILSGPLGYGRRNHRPSL
jgi:hypothetical protein